MQYSEDRDHTVASGRPLSATEHRPAWILVQVGAEVLDAGEHGSAVVGPSESDGTDMEQTAELQDLGISVFSGADLERGVLEEMDRIVQQKEAEERRKAAEKKLLTVRKDIT
ncbi:hypothetical protein MRX96_008488 [Rhipicephalus microplus]